MLLFTMDCASEGLSGIKIMGSAVTPEAVADFWMVATAVAMVTTLKTNKAGLPSVKAALTADSIPFSKSEGKLHLIQDQVDYQWIA